MNQLQASDTDLIREVLAGKTQTYAVLMERYQHMVFTLAMRMMGDRGLAEEATQDVFVKAYQSLAGFRGESKYSTWLYRVAYRKILDVLDREKRKRAHLSDCNIENVEAGGMDSTWSEVLGKERDQVLTKALNMLSPEENSLLSLFYLQELSLKEIAEVINLDPSVVKVRLFRARQRLKKILENSSTGQLLQTYER